MITASDLLTIAEEIKSQGDDEIYHRTVVNRAYYSAYHCCLPLGSTLPAPSRDPKGSHVRLSDQLTEAREKDLMKAGYILKQLHGLRVDADYEIDTNFDEKNVTLAINQSKRVHSLVAPHYASYGITISL